MGNENVTFFIFLFCSSGSEHSIDGKKFAMELHLVFYNSLYETFDEAKNEVDGLAVLAFFYEVRKVAKI
jgi:carbonic anhydrase